MTPEALKHIMLEKALTDSVERAGFIYGFRTAEKIYTQDDEMKNQVEEVLQWFKLAVPDPTNKNKCVQVGCHFEETAEMMMALGDEWIGADVERCAKAWKVAEGEDAEHMATHNIDKKELLDSLCDQIVTAIGVAHMFRFDIVGALAEVNRSNFSKFVDGKPVFNEQGKIAKPNSYNPPQLEQFLGK